MKLTHACLAVMAVVYFAGFCFGSEEEQRPDAGVAAYQSPQTDAVLADGSQAVAQDRYGSSSSSSSSSGRGYGKKPKKYKKKKHYKKPSSSSSSSSHSYKPKKYKKKHYKKPSSSSSSSSSG